MGDDRVADAVHADWRRAPLAPADRVLAEMCIDCHDQASDRDYLFGTDEP